MKDPYTLELLKRQQTTSNMVQLEDLLISRKTYCNEQLKNLVSKAKAMAQELGPSAMEWYLHQCMAQFTKMANTKDQQLLDLTVDERQYLLKILQKLPFSSFTLSPQMSLDSISYKVATLVDLLISEASDNPNFTGLVFVEQRVWVAALIEILSVHPQTRELFRVGSFIGTSQSSKRKATIATLAEPTNQQTTLEDFRAGMINLVLATSVLEEGIDVSSCHLVICFERPKNLKSFIQRRGRARKQQSKYFIFVPDTADAPSAESWQSLEEAMRAAYENDLRKVEHAEESEQQQEDGERHYEIPSTG